MSRSDRFSAVRNIADAVCSDSATQQDLVTLEQLLKGDIEAQRFYYDYLSMHAQLSNNANNGLEFVYRRMTEEFVVRHQDHKAANEPINDELIEPNNVSTPPFRLALFFALIFFVIISLLLWVFHFNASPTYVAKIVNGHIAISGQGEISGSNVLAGNYSVEQDSKLQLVNGDYLHLKPGSVIKLFNNNEIRLRRGTLHFESISAKNTIIHSRNFILLTNGSDLTLDLTKNQPLVTSGDNTLLMPANWRPSHFWSFNSNSDRVLDSAGNAFGVAASGVKKVQGAIGKGAAFFDNSRNARIELGSGGGTAPGTGSFSVTDGVTIEALIKPLYSGKLKELDEIFRKDHGDDELRMLLSFQHDKGKTYVHPAGNYAESLSFGLFILGQGYQELKLPLDGQDGRPTLTELKDGNYHHVVASYNVLSGLKAIYINGEKLAWHQYPPGSKMLSGGPGMAAIGNNPVKERWHEAFHGEIDELAFYDFALTEYVLNQHWQNVNEGRNYFGLPPNEDHLPDNIKMPLPANSTMQVSPITGLPEYYK